MLEFVPINSITNLNLFQQEYDISDRDYTDQILIAIDGPTMCQINELFHVTVRITNLSKKSKRFSLGINEEDKEIRLEIRLFFFLISKYFLIRTF